MLDTTGLIVTDALINIVDPVTNQTWAFLTTDGQIHVFNGVGYDVITGGGAGSGITQLTGDVTAGPGSGSEAATIAAAAVTLAKIANAAANSKLVGSGASGSGASYSEITLGTNLSMSGTTLNAATGGGGGDLTLVQSQLLTGAATAITFSGLDGNTDRMYRLLGMVKIAVNSSSLTLQINGATTNLSYTRNYNGGNDTNSMLIGPINSPSTVMLDIILMAKADPNGQSFNRSAVAQMHYSAGGSSTLIAQEGILWNDSSTNITSLGIADDQANGIANGSYLSLYKYGQ